MEQTPLSQEILKEYPVWDRTTRLFHWVNVISVVGLIGIGLVIMNAAALGVTADGKLLLKSVHVYIGYVFCANLLWRFIWAFTGNRFARWRAILPGGRGYGRALASYVSGFLSGHPLRYLGHNPLARVMVTVLLVLLLTQAVTGLVLAGTDLFYPPFGHEIKEWVAGTGEDHEKLRLVKPGSKENVDEQAYEEMRAFRKGFAETHEVVFFLLLFLIALHIAGVVVTELKEGSGLVSSMITGRKFFRERPEDDEDVR